MIDLDAEERTRLIEMMFVAYLRDEDGGEYSGSVAAFNVVFPEIVEMCALEAEKYGATYIAERIRNLKYAK